MNLVRYCPECGNIGSTDRFRFKRCCPDGNRATWVPPEVADQARAGFLARLAWFECGEWPDTSADIERLSEALQESEEAPKNAD